MEQKWDMERDVLDAITQLYPDRTFLKVSDRGRPFKHIPYRPYTFTPHAIDLHPLIKKTKRSVNVEPHLQRFHESLGRCKQILAEPKTLLSDFELQEELAFKLAVEPLMAGLAYRQENDLYKAALAMLE